MRLLLILSVIGASYAAELKVQNLLNTKVDRTVDLLAHHVKTSTKITFENKDAASVNYYLASVEPELAKHLSYISATCQQDVRDHPLVVKKASVSGSQPGVKYFEVVLPPGVKPGATHTLSIDLVFTHVLENYPKEIVQNENQLIRFIGNRHFYSPYPSTTESSVFKLPSAKIQSHTDTKPVTKSDNVITYGPHSTVKVYSKEDVVLHYENNSPALTITEMTRLIEISHWGNIAVEESIEIHHTGAALKGSFSRFDYQRKPDVHSSVKSFKSLLPASARDVYYRDEIGNISTSSLLEKSESVELELRPRFPLFGGWKTQYTIGYNVPGYEYQFHSGDNFALKMRVVDHVYDDQVVDKVTVRVVLPEGASNIKLHTPYDVVRMADEVKHTYLDTIGRPVVVFYRENAVDQHIQDFELEYTYPRIYMLQEPLLIVFAFLLLFLSVIFIMRLDFSISKDEAQESRLRLASLVDEVQSVQDKRASLYQSFEDAIVKFKSGKDQNALSVSRKKIEASFKSFAEQLKSIQAKARTSHGADVADKIGQIQGLDNNVREQLAQAVQMAERLISGKLPKQAYLDQDSANKAARASAIAKMDSIIASM